MTEEIADAEDSFHQGKQCSVHQQMQSTQIWVSGFSLQANTSESRTVSLLSSSHGLSIGITHTSSYFCSKHKSPEIVLHMAPNQFEVSTLECLFVLNFVVSSPTWNNWDKIGSLTSGLLFWSCCIFWGC